MKEDPLCRPDIQVLSPRPFRFCFLVAAGLIEKYGFVPKSIYPESFHSSNSGKLNNLLT